MEAPLGPCLALTPGKSLLVCKLLRSFPGGSETSRHTRGGERPESGRPLRVAGGGGLSEGTQGAGWPQDETSTPAAECHRLYRGLSWVQSCTLSTRAPHHSTDSGCVLGGKAALTAGAQFEGQLVVSALPGPCPVLPLTVEQAQRERR